MLHDTRLERTRFFSLACTRRWRGQPPIAHFTRAAHNSSHGERPSRSITGIVFNRSGVLTRNIYDRVAKRSNLAALGPLHSNYGQHQKPVASAAFSASATLSANPDVPSRKAAIPASPPKNAPKAVYKAVYKPGTSTPSARLGRAPATSLDWKAIQQAKERALQLKQEEEDREREAAEREAARIRQEERDEAERVAQVVAAEAVRKRREEEEKARRLHEEQEWALAQQLAEEARKEAEDKADALIQQWPRLDLGEKEARAEEIEVSLQSERQVFQTRAPASLQDELQQIGIALTKRKHDEADLRRREEAARERKEAMRRAESARLQREHADRLGMALLVEEARKGESGRVIQGFERARLTNKALQLDAYEKIKSVYQEFRDGEADTRIEMKVLSDHLAREAKAAHERAMGDSDATGDAVAIMATKHDTGSQPSSTLGAKVSEIDAAEMKLDSLQFSRHFMDFKREAGLRDTPTHMFRKHIAYRREEIPLLGPYSLPEFKIGAEQARLEQYLVDVYVACHRRIEPDPLAFPKQSGYEGASRRHDRAFLDGFVGYQLTSTSKYRQEVAEGHDNRVYTTPEGREALAYCQESEAALERFLGQKSERTDVIGSLRLSSYRRLLEEGSLSHQKHFQLTFLLVETIRNISGHVRNLGDRSRVVDKATIKKVSQKAQTLAVLLEDPILRRAYRDSLKSINTLSARLLSLVQRLKGGGGEHQVIKNIKTLTVRIKQESYSLGQKAALLAHDMGRNGSLADEAEDLRNYINHAIEVVAENGASLRPHEFVLEIAAKQVRPRLLAQVRPRVVALRKTRPRCSHSHKKPLARRPDNKSVMLDSNTSMTPETARQNSLPPSDESGWGSSSLGEICTQPILHGRATRRERVRAMSRPKAKPASVSSARNMRSIAPRSVPDARPMAENKRPYGSPVRKPDGGSIKRESGRSTSRARLRESKVREAMQIKKSGQKETTKAERTWGDFSPMLISESSKSSGRGVHGPQKQASMVVTPTRDVTGRGLELGASPRKSSTTNRNTRSRRKRARQHSDDARGNDAPTASGNRDANDAKVAQGDQNSRSAIGFSPTSPLQRPVNSISDAFDCADFDQPDAMTADSLTPPVFNMSTTAVEEARRRNPGEEVFWQYTLYRRPDGNRPTLHYCKTKAKVEATAQYFLEEKVLGLDLEWASNRRETAPIKEQVSLIQIASESRVALFQVALHEGTTAESLMAPTLKAILESPHIIKAGVNIKGDCTRLEKHLNVKARGVFELSHLYRLLMYGKDQPALVTKQVVGLARQVKELFDMPLYKGDVRYSAWNYELKHAQCVYAASDAYAGYQIFRELERRRLAMRPVPPRPALVEEDKPLRLLDGSTFVKSPKSASDPKKKQYETHTVDPTDDNGGNTGADMLEPAPLHTLTEAPKNNEA